MTKTVPHRADKATNHLFKFRLNILMFTAFKKLNTELKRTLIVSLSCYMVHPIITTDVYELT